jgi:hypothetical protein
MHIDLSYCGLVCAYLMIGSLLLSFHCRSRCSQTKGSSLCRFHGE